MAIIDKPAVFAAPGEAGSPVSLKARYDNFIGGDWVAPLDGRVQENLSPVTGHAFCEVPRSTAADIELALDAAHAAKDAWGAASATERAAVLNAIADAIDANLEMLAVAESWENGKPVRETLAADIPLAADHFRYFAGVIRGEEGSLTEIDEQHRRLPLPRAAGRGRPDHPVQLPAADGGVEDRPGPGRRQLHGRQAGEPDAVVDPQVRRAHPGHRPARRDEHRQRPRRGDRARARLEQAHRQGRLHRRDRHRPPDHGLRRAEPDPLDDGARRQVAEHLLRRRDGPRRRLPRQGDRGPRALRLQQGRGLHVPLARADRGVDLRAVHGTRARAHRGDHAGQPARPDHDDRGAGLARRSSRRSRATSRSAARRAPRS